MNRIAGTISALVALLALTGCGHPATRSECEEIVSRTAELELRGQNISDPKVLAERMATPGSMQKMHDAIESCIGKRVTTSAMECVRKAGKASEMDNCFR